jgi:hypothetical protein
MHKFQYKLSNLNFLTCANLHKFAHDRKFGFSIIYIYVFSKLQIWKCDVVLKFSGLDSSSYLNTILQVGQTQNGDIGLGHNKEI